MMRVTNPEKVPFGGVFIYVQPESQVEFRHHTLMHLRVMVKKHRLANNYPIGSNFEQEIQDYICAHQEGICTDYTPPVKLTKFQLAVKFGKAMLEWASDGFRHTTPEQYVARREICDECPFWAGEGAHWWTGRCSKCGCSGLKLHVATERCPIGKWEKL